MALMNSKFLSYAAPFLALLLAAPLATAQTTAPTSQPWGKEVDGLRVRIETLGDIPQGGKIALHLTLKNVNERPVNGKGAFVWIFIAQSKEKAFYTEKIDLTNPDAGINLLPDPAAIDAETQVDADLVLTTKKSFAYEQALKVVAGYPQQDPDTQPVGQIQNLLSVGKAKARAMIYVPATKSLVASNTLDLLISDPQLATLTAEAKKHVIADLMELYRRDPVGGLAAHDRSVKLGKDLVPDLLEGLKQKPALPDFGEMWLITALIDIRDDQALPALLDKLAHGPGGTKCVIAYHGPKMKIKALDEAIVAAAGKDATVAGWAARGFAAFGRGIRQDLIAQGIKSPDPQTRANLAEALVVQPTPVQITQLGSLLQDDDATVRGAVAQTIAKANVRSPRLIALMIDALAKPGDGGKAALCDALGKLTTRQAPYDPQATPKEKQAVIKTWTAWWATAEKTWK